MLYTISQCNIIPVLRTSSLVSSCVGKWKLRFARRRVRLQGDCDRPARRKQVAVSRLSCSEQYERSHVVNWCARAFKHGGVRIAGTAVSALMLVTSYCMVLQVRFRVVTLDIGRIHLACSTDMCSIRVMGTGRYFDLQ